MVKEFKKMKVFLVLLFALSMCPTSWAGVEYQCTLSVNGKKVEVKGETSFEVTRSVSKPILYKNSRGGETVAYVGSEKYGSFDIAVMDIGVAKKDGGNDAGKQAYWKSYY